MADKNKGLGGFVDDAKNAVGMNDDQKKGWQGDPEGHAKAGRKGGQASSQNNQENNEEDTSEE